MRSVVHSGWAYSSSKRAKSWMAASSVSALSVESASVQFSDLVEQMEEGAVNTLQELADAGSKVRLITTKPA